MSAEDSEVVAEGGRAEVEIGWHYALIKGYLWVIQVPVEGLVEGSRESGWVILNRRNWNGVSAERPCLVKKSAEQNRREQVGGHHDAETEKDRLRVR